MLLLMLKNQCVQQERRSVVHKLGLWHRAVYVFVFNSQGSSRPVVAQHTHHCVQDAKPGFCCACNTCRPVAHTEAVFTEESVPIKMGPQCSRYVNSSYRSPESYSSKKRCLPVARA
jgi:hypothetical protein